MNEMREKIVEAIVNSGVCEGEFADPTQRHIAEDLADALLASGLMFNPETDIRPKFKVGQTVWYILESKNVVNVVAGGDIISEIILSARNVKYGFKSTVKSETELFATEAEALAALWEAK